ncbi:MAG: hypothetical protein GY756_13055 [bacterium]|nr:hypothetical protein [bacterium]
MKKVFVIITAILLAANTFAQTAAESNKNKVGLDFYLLPMLFGEYGGQLSFAAGDHLGVGLQMVYYNPSMGLTGVIVKSQLGPGDVLDMNVSAILPGVSLTYYSKPRLKGFYVGGLVRYKRAKGDVLLKDKFTGGTAYKGIVEADIAVNSININLVSGYRFAFDNGFSLTLGLALGGQINLKDDTRYTIIESYEESDGITVKDDLQEGVEQQMRSFINPITFQAIIGLGFTF